MDMKNYNHNFIKNILFVILIIILLPFIIFTSSKLNNSSFYRIFYFILQIFLTFIILNKFKNILKEACLIYFDNGKFMKTPKNMFSNIKLILCVISYFIVMYLLLMGLARTYVIYFSIFIFLMTIKISSKKIIIGNTYVYISGLIEEDDDSTPLQTKFLINLKENAIFIKKTELKRFEFIGDILFITLSNESCIPINFEGIDKDKFFEMIQ